MSEVSLPANRGRNLQSGQAILHGVGALFSLFFGFVTSLVFLGGFRQWLDEWRIGVKLGAGASSSTLLAVFAPGSLDALQLSDA